MFEMIRFFIGALSLLMCSFSMGQNLGIDAGIGIGASGYRGDLNTSKFSSYGTKVNFAAELEGNVQFNRWFSSTLSFTYGKVRGNDRYREEEDPLYERNLDFNSHLFELALLGEFHFIGNADLEDRWWLSPYLTAGVAGFRYNPTTTYLDEKVELRPLHTEGQGLEDVNATTYGKLGFSLPFGIGTRIRVRHPWSIKLDVIARYTFTDYLDDVSKSYVSSEILEQNFGELSVALSDRRTEPSYEGMRGTSDAKDLYFTYMITFAYNIQSTNRNGVFCPRVEKPIF